MGSVPHDPAAVVRRSEPVGAAEVSMPVPPLVAEIAVAFQVPLPMVPVAVIAERLPVVTTVPLLSGSVSARAAVALGVLKVVEKVAAVLRSSKSLSA